MLSRCSSHLLEILWSHRFLDPVLVCTHRQHLCQGQETAGPALPTFSPCWQESPVQAVQNPLFCPCCLCVDPHHTTYINKLKIIQKFATKLDTGHWFPGCQDPIQIMNWLPLACCMPKMAESCCCTNIFCLVVQSYHPQY